MTVPGEAMRGSRSVERGRRTHRGDRHRELGGWRGGTWRVAVVPQWRRKGVGTRLVAVAEERLEGLGPPKVGALVLREQDHALGFWRALGYAPDARVDRWVRSFR